MTLPLAVAVLVAGGVYLVLQRGLVRVALGFVLLGHAVNLVLLAAGGSGRREPPLGSVPDPAATADPLPQAFALTAIVITFGVSIYLLGLAAAGARHSSAEAAVISLLPLVVAGPLLAAALTLATANPVLRRVAGLAVAAGVLAAAVVLGVATRDGEVLVAQVAGWPAGVAIAFAADLFAALMLGVSSLLVLVCSAFAAATGDDQDRFFVPLVLVLSGGVYGAFLTADLFNLFVLIEVALTASYVLLTQSGTAGQLVAGRLYLTVNLLASIVFLLGVALIYGAAGTVNLGELAGAGRDSTPVAVAASVLLVALSVKAAVVPVHGWLPRAHPQATPAVTALFSGLLTKIGVYALFRVYAVIFGGDPRLHGVLLAVMLASMVVGVLGALGEGTMRAMLAFHMVSQVGYVLLGLVFFGPVGLAAAIFHLLHYSVVKTGLFLSVGAVEVSQGTGRLDRLGGLARRESLLALAFAGSAFSLVGAPPFSGFIAKLGLLRAAVLNGEYLAAGAVVGVGLFTLLSMLKLWNGVFWGDDPRPGTATTQPSGGLAAALAVEAHSRAPARASRRLVLPGVGLALLSMTVGLAAEPLLALTGQAAAGLVDPSMYVAAVTGR